MRILMTGASCFTGRYFLRALRDAGHEVVAPSGLRIGDTHFHDALDRGIDVFCHHGFRGQKACLADGEFDPMIEAYGNVWYPRHQVRSMARAGVKRVVMTGTYFEPGEGGPLAPDHPDRSPDAYGVAKRLASMALEEACRENGIFFSKFVIPNPFGPGEPRDKFVSQAARAWFRGEEFVVRTPAYIRDNIHVGVLARCYARFVGELTQARRMAPSGQVSSMGVFADTVAAEFHSRLGIEALVRWAKQTEFPEGSARSNGDNAHQLVRFDDAEEWDRAIWAYKECYG